MRELDHHLRTLRDSAAFNSYNQAPPEFTQWPDDSRLWEAAE